MGKLSAGSGDRVIALSGMWLREPTHGFNHEVLLVSHDLMLGGIVTDCNLKKE